MQIIINWLGGKQNFTVGATLYQTFGSNEAFKKLLSNGETPAARTQLAEELRKLLVKEKTDQVPSRPEKGTKIVADETPQMSDSDDDVLKAIHNEWLPLYQRMNLLRHSLDKHGDDNSAKAIAYRKPIAAEVKKLERQINAIWEKQKYYEKEGKLPFVATKTFELPKDPMKLAQLINNIKKNIRTNRKLMKDNPGVPKYAQLYNDYKEKHKLVTGKDYEEKD